MRCTLWRSLYILQFEPLFPLENIFFLKAGVCSLSQHGRFLNTTSTFFNGDSTWWVYAVRNEWNRERIYMDKRRGVAYVLQITQPNITPHTTQHRTFTYLSKVDSLSSHVYCCSVQVGDRMFGRTVSLFEPNGFSNLLCFWLVNTPGRGFGIVLVNQCCYRTTYAIVDNQYRKRFAELINFAQC